MPKSVSAQNEHASESAANAKPAGREAEYTVLARRYRPKQFLDCVGQEHVAQSLGNAIEGDRVAHAYLFCGARGVGKTSTARIFAKALNCVTGPTKTPCDECDICKSITAGEDVDVIEIDGASNRGIDEVRELRQGVNFRPSRSRYKIYIIDEVHMLTKEAFNALLKTLEEPPPHAKFIFATTEPQKIPITILSRCQRFDFLGVELTRIMGRLREIVAAEGLQAEEEALEAIARRAGGSMRDSQSLLDQLLAFGGDKLKADDVHRVLGTAGEDRVIELATAIFAGDAAACLKMVEQSQSGGVQLGEWVEQMLDYFRDLLVLGISPDAELVSMPNRLRPAMLEQAKSRPTETLIEMMDLLAACRSRMRASTYGRTLLEMTLVRLCRLDQFANIGRALQNVGTISPAPIAPAPAIRPITTPAVVDSKKNGMIAEPTATASALAMPSAPHSAVAPSPPAGPQLPTIELTEISVGDLWRHVLLHLNDPVMTGMLQAAEKPTYRPPNHIVIRFAIPFAKTYCEESSRSATIQDVCSRIAGRAVLPKFELGTPATPATPVINESQLRQLAAQDPLVRKAEEVLDARLLHAAKYDPPATMETTPAATANAAGAEREGES